MTVIADLRALRAGAAGAVAWAERIGEDVAALPATRALLEQSETVPGDGLQVPAQPGSAYENALGTASRRRGGAWYTPEWLTRLLTRLALETWSGEGLPRVTDPACGAGAFLLAAAEELARRGAREAQVAALLRGCDVDPGALLIARSSLELFGIERGWAPEWAAQVALRHEDFLDGAPASAAPDGRRSPDAKTTITITITTTTPADVIVGNPPFLSQLRERTRRDADTARRTASDYGAAGRGYVDGSALFAVQSVRAVGAGGVVCLVMPESFLCARDAAGARAELRRTSQLAGFWRQGDERPFSASVRVCAPVLVKHVGADQAQTTRWEGRSATRLAPRQLAGAQHGSWASLIADRFGGPAVAVTGPATLGSVATVAADFRDEFYALAELVAEAPADPDGSWVPLITSGLIDPAECLWGRRSARFAKVRRLRPALRRAELEAHPTLGPWAAKRLRPKVLLATQTRVLEAICDPAGAFAPSVPVLSVLTEGEDPWTLAALLNSPPAAAWAIEQVAGSALGGDAIKLSARVLRDLPLPADLAALRTAGSRLAAAHDATDDPFARRAALVACAREVCGAYALPDAGADTEALMAWWSARLPALRDTGQDPTSRSPSARPAAPGRTSGPAPPGGTTRPTTRRSRV